MTETKTKLESGFTFYFRITDKKLQGGKNDYQDSVKKMAEFLNRELKSNSLRTQLSQCGKMKVIKMEEDYQ